MCAWQPPCLRRMLALDSFSTIRFFCSFDLVANLESDYCLIRNSPPAFFASLLRVSCTSVHLYAKVDHLPFASRPSLRLLHLSLIWSRLQCLTSTLLEAHKFSVSSLNACLLRLHRFALQSLRCLLSLRCNARPGQGGQVAFYLSYLCFGSHCFSLILGAHFRCLDSH